MNELDAPTPSVVSGPKRGTMLHPAAGVLVLILDWALFSGTLISAGTAMWLLSLIGFIGGSLGSFLIQRRLAKESFRSSWVKGLFCGLAVGLPFPVAGTAVGGWILAASGLNRLRRGRVSGS